jgi:hypothetical protein
MLNIPFTLDSEILNKLKINENPYRERTTWEVFDTVCSNQRASWEPALYQHNETVSFKTFAQLINFE